MPTRFGRLLIFAGAFLQTVAIAVVFPNLTRIPDGLGVNIHFFDAQAGEFEMLKAAGFRWVRMDFPWSEIEKAKGQYDFSAPERLVNICRTNHIRIIAIFDYSSPFYDENVSPHSDEGVAAFTKYAVATAKHFKGNGMLWEMYNEPNIGFWRPKPDVNAYTKLALAVGKALKSELPNELYCGPALSGTDGAWLEQCYKAGLLQYWDAVTFHPYGDKAPEERETHFKGARELVDRYTPPGKHIPLLSGEWGYTAASVGRETQGKYLAREFLFNICSGLPLSIWYDWRDDGANPKEGEHNFGTVANAYHKDQDPVLEPNPAYVAAKTLAAQLDGFSFSRRLILTNSQDFALLFTKGKATRVAAWTTSAKPHPTTVSLPSGAYAVTSCFGAPLLPIRSESNAAIVELTDAPRYIVSR